MNAEATVWLGGDLNLPDITWDSESITANNYPKRISECMLDTMHYLGLEQVVDFSTRGSNTLDIFMTNKPTLVNRCEPVPGVSDHETAVFVEAHIIARRMKNVRQKIYLWNKGDFHKIRADISEFTEAFVQAHTLDTPVDELWSSVRDKIKNTTDKHVPSKMASSRFYQPWITGNLKRLARRKKRCYSKAKRSSDKDHWSKFHQLKKRMQSECRIAYNKYINSIICSDSSDVSGQSSCNKRFYSYIKSLRKDSSGVAPLKEGGVVYLSLIHI